MKKTIIGILQIIIFIVSYYVCVFVLHFLFELLLNVFAGFAIFNFLVNGIMLESIRYIILPLLIGIVLVSIEHLVTLKEPLYFPCFIIIMIVCVYLNANMVINCLIQYGMLNWTFVNTFGYALVLCGVLGYGLFQQTNFKLEQK